MNGNVAVRAAFACAVATLIVSCGGGGGGDGGSGGGGGGGSSGRPGIAAVVLSFPTGEVPPGFLLPQYNTGTAVQVVEDDGATPITDATVTVNGVVLSYFPARESYEGQLVVNPGQRVTVEVDIDGVGYSATHRQLSAYPTIVAPTAGAELSSLNTNVIRWSAVPPSSRSQYEVGIFDTEGNMTWPGGGYMDVPNTQNSVTISPAQLTGGEQWVLVGLIDGSDISGALNGSGVVVGGFTYVPITVTTQADILTGIETSPASGSVGLNSSRPLTATGQYQDGSERDVTAAVAWSSSDDARVAVDAAGLVTGIAAGEATITAELEGFTASSVVTVFVPTPSPATPLSNSVAYQVDYAHSGRATFGVEGPVFPPGAHWSTPLNGIVSYPVIADGRVFVTTYVDAAGGTDGTSLYALDLATGQVLWGPITIPGGQLWSGHAYDQGRLFVLNRDGVLRSFDAASGAPGWSVALLDGNIYTVPPVAVNGVVYVSGGGQLVALDAVDGGQIWASSYSGGDQSAPTFSGDGVFIANTCQVYKFDPYSGSTLWHYRAPCFGGGKNSVYANGELFVRDPAIDPTNPIFNADTGEIVGSTNDSVVPAFSETTGFHLEFGLLRAVDQASRETRWTFEGDGFLVTAPIVIDDVVFIGSSSGTVYGLDAADGSVRWSAVAGTEIEGPDEQNYRRPLVGLGAGEGYLLVPASNALSAWRLVP